MLLDGTNISQANDVRLARYRKGKIGIIFQEYQLFEELNSLENVAMPLVVSNMTIKQRHAKAMTLLETVGLADRATHLPRQLSGGERQRVAVARALIHDRSTAWFFLLHYGVFHIFYGVFLVSAISELSPGFLLHGAIGLALFLFNHAFSYRYNKKRDASGSPNIGTIMFFPYARIIPMHLVIIIGASIGGGSISRRGNCQVLSL